MEDEGGEGGRLPSHIDSAGKCGLHGGGGGRTQRPFSHLSLHGIFHPGPLLQEVKK
jgi:hypothetical protein